MQAKCTTRYAHNKQVKIALYVKNNCCASEGTYDPREDVSFMQRNPEACTTANMQCKVCSQNDLCTVLYKLQQAA